MFLNNQYNHNEIYNKQIIITMFLNNQYNHIEIYNKKKKLKLCSWTTSIITLKSIIKKIIITKTCKPHIN